MSFETIFNLIFSVSIVYGLVVALFLYFRGQRQKRRSVTLDYIKRWNQEYAFIEENNLRNGIYSKFESSIVSSLRSRNMPDESKSLIATWNFYEELAIAIFFTEADEEMAKEFFFYSLVNSFKASEKAIDLYRKKAKNKASYANFERLYGKWVFDREYVLIREVTK